ncbi:MAG: aminofutalosine synthase MqnE [Bacteroidetes bacterium]|nr:aminofutalosine synthase MqnE [Bacteroidota bacterium]
MFQSTSHGLAAVRSDAPQIEREIPIFEEAKAFAGLEDIYSKVKAGERLNREDGIRLYNTDNLLALGFLANMVRERINGANTYFVRNYYLNYTNICELDCKFCSFYRKEGQDGAFLMSLDHIFKTIESDKENITEMHIVGGLHDGLPYDYYLQMLRGIKKIDSRIHIKAFTAVEIDFFARLYGLTVEKVLLDFKEAGLDAMPGGGAEIFSDRVREKMFADKIGADEWVSVIKTAHRLGIPSNATMLYGHMEKIEERVDHLIRLREVQDETNGFFAFIPLAYHPHVEDSTQWATGVDNLKSIAVSRLMLDNFPHIKAYWISMGAKVAQISLGFGADDLDGTVRDERVFHMAGASTENALTKRQLVKLIKDAGRIPIERDALYNAIENFA